MGKAYTSQLPPAPQPEQIDVVEMGGLYTFFKRKNKAYVITFVDRTTRCILCWPVSFHPDKEIVQNLARLVCKPRCFSRCSDALCRAVQLLVYCWNQPQLYKHRYPGYPAHLIEFLPNLA